MPMYEYWIGRDIDYDQLWNDYEAGQGYIQKFHSMRVHLIRITLVQPQPQVPLFNHEAVFKTIKGYFHDLKQLCLAHDEYLSAGPLFLYSVERASGIWSFLGELRQLLLLGTTLADEKVIGEKLANMDKRLEFLRKHFGGAVSSEDFQMFMRAKTPRQLEKAAQHLIEQGVKRVEISREPFIGNIKETEATLVDVKKLLAEADEKRS